MKDKETRSIIKFWPLVYTYKFKMIDGSVVTGKKYCKDPTQDTYLLEDIHEYRWFTCEDEKIKINMRNVLHCEHECKKWGKSYVLYEKIIKNGGFISYKEIKEEL